ncbi:MAG: PH domain-containing protein, partial [Flavobacteriia bacterium]|nr:PH domain-containing protein [Flavobacteriia bacterium]
SIILSSPAPSFDRIIVKYGKFDEIILSPKDKFKFTKDLKQINPDIVDKVNPVPEN